MGLERHLTAGRGGARARAPHGAGGPLAHRDGDGVCGTAVSEDRNQIVDDVREVENYLACSIHTRSELVVLIRDSGEIVGEFDIDSDTVGAFSAEDESLLEEMGALISSRVASLATAHVGN